jgi:microcompartment protein CcmL/EutN
LIRRATEMDFSLGLLEVSALGHAIIALDAMLKVADVEFVATERKLGGRLVTLVVKGELTSVKAAVDAGIESAKSNGVYKASNVIARPHEEILKFLHLDEEHEKPVNSESAATHVGSIPSEEAAHEESSEQEAQEQSKPARRRGRRRKSDADSKNN